MHLQSLRLSAAVSDFVVNVSTKSKLNLASWRLIISSIFIVFFLQFFPNNDEVSTFFWGVKYQNF